MKFTITKEFHFEASHSLPSLPEGHKCRRNHGHSYRVIVELASDALDQHGFVIDYGDLRSISNDIDHRLDHQNLNEVFDGPTSAERIALECFITWRRFYPELQAVTICETAATSATVRL